MENHGYRPSTAAWVAACLVLSAAAGCSQEGGTAAIRAPRSRALSAATPPSCTAIPDIVGCWTFDGDASDQSGNGHDGVLVGAPEFTTGAGGVAGTALALDGVDDYVRIENTGGAFDLSEFTLVVTVRLPDFAREAWLVSKGTDFGNFTLNVFDQNQPDWPGYAAYVHQIATGNWSSLASRTPVPAGEYFQSVVTVSPTAYHAYLNGAPQYSAVPTPPLLKDAPVLIGAGGWDGVNTYFVGAIDEVRIYRRALSPEEVQSLYPTATEPTLAELVAELVAAVEALDPATLKNPNMQHALLQKLAEVAALIDAGQLAEARNKLVHDLLAKTDGCGAAPDANDWVRDCAAQGTLQALIEALIAAIDAA